MPMSVIMPYPMTDHVIARIEAKLPLVRLWEAEGQTATIRESVSVVARPSAKTSTRMINPLLSGRSDRLALILTKEELFG